jgi:hypothetical protein
MRQIQKIGNNNQDIKDDGEKPVVHRIQPIHGSESLILVLPKKQLSKLQIEKGDYVKCSLRNNQLIVEKIDV